MRKYNFLSKLFSALAILFSNVMCAAIAYNYCALEWGEKYAGYSAPPITAFVLVLPYGLIIIASLILSRIFKKI